MPTVAWLLDSDPAIRWQVMRDLLASPAEEVAAERRRVAEEGVGAQLLALQGADGTWGSAAWNRGFTSAMHVLMLLRDFGLDPASDAARRAIQRVGERVTWEGPPPCEGSPFFAGEVEPCINGQVAAVGAYFQRDVSGIIERLLDEQLPDGGWNCEVSAHSSFNTTICVLEALLAQEHAGLGTRRVQQARLRGQEYLLARQLRRRLSTGEVITSDRKGGSNWSRLAFPTWWHYDLLRGLDYLRSAGATSDPRLDDALALLESKRDSDGHWPLEVRYPGPMPIDLDETVGAASRWLTLRALRVLMWFGR